MSDTRARHRHPRRATSRARAARRGVEAVAAVVSLVLFVGSAIAWYNYRALDSGIKSIHIDGLGGPVTPGDGGSGPARPAGKDQNILIVGDDSRAGLTAAEGRKLSTGTAQGTTSTDTLLLVHVPADGSRSTLISIPRDSYVDIPGHPRAKINAAYADGYYYTDGATTPAQRQAAGVDLLVATVKKLTGVPIDHYVQIGFAGFEKVVTAIGGIDVNLCHAVDDTVAYNREHGGNGGSGFVSPAGLHHLDPVRALQFVRQRHNLPGIGDDLGREKRQRYFLSAAFQQVLSARILLDPLKLNDTVQAIAGAFVKDDGFSLVSFAQQMASLSAGGITGATVPTGGAQDVSGVGSVLMVDPAKVQLAVHRAFYGSPAPSRTAAPSTSGPVRTTTPTAPIPHPSTSVPVTAHCVD
ncbi:MAG TPA: LCP family protein [Jatrophihabitans sp.]|uniref:LCP family protein n=1 Tax=Jatrophihabitans sp. TaxID=1932789 RepID=UPI002DFB37C5|nr:LCP family protein [Jatrophihabitans sp.]